MAPAVFLSCIIIPLFPTGFSHQHMEKLFFFFFPGPYTVLLSPSYFSDPFRAKLSRVPLFVASSPSSVRQPPTRLLPLHSTEIAIVEVTIVPLIAKCDGQISLFIISMRTICWSWLFPPFWNSLLPGLLEHSNPLIPLLPPWPLFLVLLHWLHISMASKHWTAQDSVLGPHLFSFSIHSLDESFIQI